VLTPNVERKELKETRDAARPRRSADTGVNLMRFGNSPASLLVIAAVILFLLAAFGVDLGSIAVIPLGLAALSASFLFGGGSKLL